MKSMYYIFLFMMFCAFVSGCASVDISDKGSHSVVSIHNTGWEIFSLVPIASGDPDQPNRNTCRWFTDTITLENNVKMLEYAMKTTNATGYRNLSSSIVDETVFFFLLNRRIYHTSAELVFDGSIPQSVTNTTASVGK